MIALTIYSRPGCHLCEEMKAVIERVARHVSLTLEEIDVSGEPTLEERHGLEVPVLLVNGEKAAKYRITEAELMRLLIGREGRKGCPARL